MVDIYDFNNDADYIEEYANNQEFADARYDFEGPRIDLETVTETFNDRGVLLNTSYTYARAGFRDEETRENALADVVTAEDREELASSEFIWRETWLNDNVRVSTDVTVVD